MNNDLAPEELQALDDFRFRHRMPSRAAAVRELLRMGLASVGIDAIAGVKSSSYGVLNQRADGHEQQGDTRPEAPEPPAPPKGKGR
jgi:hypothetical protein